VVNSGIANVAMGARGARNAEAMSLAACRAVGGAEGEMLVASTGVIGEPLPMANLRRGIRAAAASLSERGLFDAARAIMTTDTFPKAAVVRFRIGRRDVSVAGIAKGSGMIEPDMATMLAFLVTDAAVSPAFLRAVLRRTADATFNRLSIDGETSTSDSVLLLANGAAGNPALRGSRSPGARRFESAVQEVATSLARDLARDGEGATRLVTVRVEGARSAAEAERGARRIANSLLVKTAIFGGDPNWGRILQTLGAARVHIDLDRAEVRLGGVVVFRRGTSAGPAARRRAAAKHAAREIEILVKLGAGRARAHVWTCDLSYDYVRINAEYTT
jgi:glutamate N-acetyltransferase/amino-acid N-acetyltransferase